ncbi:dipeptide epimerase [Actinacidiphila rubida]|uniref:Dipeptide epimerase n=1 Tax=Actinacidiphila rubida TaxID=310780 RepID=A0A1H8R8Y6_9ACTN|nr:dipeptide epimerase [Actinacidiphila rubida]SEO62925.1 L-alanine-DL-glutamate epimerase [Actinacidiphila rubida]
MGSPSIAVSRRDISFSLPYSYARGNDLACTVVRVEVRDGTWTGRGEGAPFESFFETSADEAVRALEHLAATVPPAALDRQALLTLMEPGAARNALDAALWDLEAKRGGRPVWELAGTPQPKPLEIMTTISMADPDQFAQELAESRHARILKLKLGSDHDTERLERTRARRPDAHLVVDVNGGWSPATLRAMLPVLERHDVRMLEQPVSRHDEECLRGLPHPMPIVADESFQHEDDLDRVTGLYDGINVKLDKCGGLTAALRIFARARARGLRLMLGCLPGSSLSSAVGFHAAQCAEFVDLDAHLRLVEDVEPRMTATGGWLQPPAPELWG